MSPRLSLFLSGLGMSLALLTATCAPQRENSPTDAKRAVRTGASLARGDETPEADVPNLPR